MKKQAGFLQIIAGLLVLLVLGGLGVGIYVANHNTYPNSKASNTETVQIPAPLVRPTASPSAAASPIETVTDLQNTQKDLDQTDVDGMTKDLSTLDSAAANF